MHCEVIDSYVTCVMVTSFCFDDQLKVNNFYVVSTKIQLLVESY